MPQQPEPVRPLSPTRSLRPHRHPVRPAAAAALAALLLAAAATACTPGPRSGADPGTPHPDRTTAAGARPQARGFTLVASGDVLPHDSIIADARRDSGGTGYDFAPMLSGVKPVVSRADLALCHMETVYGAAGDYSGYPSFKSPPEVARALRDTGYDSCSTASNHTLDDGAAGITRTLDALDRAGVRHAGTARSAEEARGTGFLRAGTARVAHLSYTYGTNDIPVPQGAPWSVNLLDPGRIIGDARAARRAGADVVLVSVHWGTEWQDAPDAQQLRLAGQLTAARSHGRPDIDLLLGTHAHIPQAYEKVNGTWVVYGMGDQIAGDMVNDRNEHDPRGNQGSIARFTFAPPTERGARWRVTKAEFIPQWFDTASGRVVDLNRAIGNGNTFLTPVRDRIRSIVLSRGAAKYGLRMGS
ncbi:CapA family protein [Streptomyces sp. NPDC058045]|uniref:CapA family protein n=1 Tax=Streptomyces sp. NPDC058045 TaxID=3346311 RepID=UPI0036E4126E